jgi:hypothetical protein
MDQKTSNKPAGWSLSMRAAEIAVALATLTFGLIVTYASYQLGARWGSDGPQAGYFPFYIGLFICVGSLVNLVAGALASRSVARQPVFVGWEALKRIISVLLPAALYVAGIHVVGIYVSSSIYIAFFMIWLGGYRVHKALAVGFGVSFVMFLMFEVWFQVLLPKGEYNVLSYFGY